MVKKHVRQIKRIGFVSLGLILILLVSVGIYLFNPLSIKVAVNQSDCVVHTDQKTYLDELVIVQLHGSPYDMGYQHGTLLKTEIMEMKEILYKLAGLNNSPKGLTKEAYLNYLVLSYYRSIPSRYLEEMKGISDGANVSLRDIILMNIFDEIQNLSQCTNLAVWDQFTQNGEIVHGRNLDYLFQKYIWDRQVVLVYNPVDGNPLVSVCWPGFIGVLTGMNEVGLTLGSMTSQIKENSISGVPAGILYRHLLQYSQNLYEAEEILKQNRRTIGNNLLVTSKQDGNGVVFEITPEEVVRRSHMGLISSANHFEILTNRNVYGRSKESVYRMNRALSAAKEYQNKSTLIDYPEMIKILEDRLVEGNGTRPIGNYMNVQSVVFLPMRSEIWIGINDVVPAAAGTFWGFKFDSASKESLTYLGRTKVQPSYLNSQVYFHRKDPAYWTDDQLARVLSRFSELDSDNLYFLYEQAKLYLNAERYEKAIELYTDLLELVGKCKEVYKGGNRFFDLTREEVQFQLAKSYYGAKDLARAHDLLEDILDNKDIPDYLFDQVSAYLDMVEKEL